MVCAGERTTERFGDKGERVGVKYHTGSPGDGQETLCAGYRTKAFVTCLWNPHYSYVLVFITNEP